MGVHAAADDDAPAAGFVPVLRTRSFATVFTAETQSIIGDQLARVALSVLVFDETSSASATASVYAVTYLPAIVGGMVLAGLGDRLPKRLVMIGADLIRAALFVLMAIPGIPVPVLAGVLAVAVFCGPAFTAAEVSFLAEALGPEAFRTATGLRMMSGQVAQVAGFGLGGLVVAVLDPRGALLVNAATFLGSALLIAVGLRTRRPSRTGRHQSALSGEDQARAGRSGSPAGVARVVRIPGLPRLLALSALAGLFVVPEGLGVPFGAQTGASTGELGLLLGSIPLGGVVGIVVLVRFVPIDRRGRSLRVMACGCGVPLIVTAFVPSWPLAVVCWFVSGVMAAFQMDVIAAMIRLVPDELRAQLVGLGSAVLLGAQGLGLLVFGALAELTAPALAVGLAGATGAVLAVALVLRPGPVGRVAVSSI